MSRNEVLAALDSMSINEQLELIEAALQRVRKAVRQEQDISAENGNVQLAMAAGQLCSEYSTNEELVAFTALDAEDFHAAG